MLMLILWMCWTKHLHKKEDVEEQERQDKEQGVVAGQS
jgi:hypothetical protein